MAALTPNFDPQFFDGGAPAAGYSLYTYATGTTTPLGTWQDQAGTVPNANPIVLDAGGRCEIWLTAGVEYRFTLKNTLGATVSGYPIDDVGGVTTTLDDASIRADLSSTASGKGADLIGVLGSTETAGALLRHTLFATSYATLQAAIDAAAGARLIFPEGTYTIPSNTSLIVPSNSHLIFEPGAVLVQASKGAYAALATLPGTVNVTIEGGDIRGPYYGTGPTAWVGVLNSVMVNGDTWAGSLKENIGIDIRGRWYQRDILGYNAAQMGALTDTTSTIRIVGTRIDGFGQEAIIADRVTGLWIQSCKMFNCGRGGLRMYGVVRGFIDSNIVGNMGPGMDGDYPNWNVYGITATRIQGTVSIPDPNLTISRCTQDVTISNNTVYNCTTWKSLDNHGSIDIRFLGNKCLNSYIGLGLDQGGTDSNRGIAPAVRNLIQGNVFESTGATYMRAGITAYGNNSTTQACEAPQIIGNTFVGYGGCDTDAAISLSNVRNAVVKGNVVKDAARAGITIALECDTAVIEGNVIDDPKQYVTVAPGAVGAGYTQAGTVSCTVTGGGGSGLVVLPIVVAGQITSYSILHPGTGYTSAPTVTPIGDGAGATAVATLNSAYGILSQTTTVKATVASNTFNNRTQATARGISVQAPASGYGVRIDHSNLFVGSFVFKVSPGLSTDSTGSYGNVDAAAARVTSAGAFTASLGFLTVFKSATGTYDMVLKYDPTSVNDLIPTCSTYAALGTARASLLGTNGKKLDFDGQTANFTLGATLTGGTSAATAVIVGQTDNGTTGTLYLKTIVGAFVDNETITDGSGGSALANGVLQTATMLTVTTSNIAGAATDTGFVINVKNINP